MDKAILVIDMPSCCEECSLMWKDEYSDFCPVKCAENKTDIYNYTHTHTKPDWCPLKPAPEEQMIWYEDGRSDWERGYNNCVYEILGRERDYE